MNTRRGLGKGLGAGYKNLAYKDPYIHGLSAKGVKTYPMLNAWKIQQQPERRPYMKCSMCGYEYNLNVDTCPQCGKECIRIDAKAISKKILSRPENLDFGKRIMFDNKGEQLQMHGYVLLKQYNKNGRHYEVYEKVTDDALKKLVKLEKEIDFLTKLEKDFYDDVSEGKYHLWDDDEEDRMDIKQAERIMHRQRKKVVNMLKAKGVDKEKLAKLKQLLGTDFVESLQKQIKQIEDDVPTTKNNYGRYMAILSNFNPQERRNVAMLLVFLGANVQGVKDAYKVLAG